MFIADLFLTGRIRLRDPHITRPVAGREVEEEVIDEKGFINTVWKLLPAAITVSAIKISTCQTGDKLL